MPVPMQQRKKQAGIVTANYTKKKKKRLFLFKSAICKYCLKHVWLELTTYIGQVLVKTHHIKEFKTIFLISEEANS